MSDIYLAWNPDTLSASPVLSSGAITQGQDLETAVIVRLFTWRRAKDDDVLPDDSGERYGFWAEAYARENATPLGSRLWLLARAKLTQQTLNLAKLYVEEALADLVENGVAQQIDVTVERYGLNSMSIQIVMYRGVGGVDPLRFEYTWRPVLNA